MTFQIFLHFQENPSHVLVYHKFFTLATQILKNVFLKLNYKYFLNKLIKYKNSLIKKYF